MTREELMDKNYTWYLSKYQELFKVYPNKYLIIANQKVEWAFDDIDSAYKFWVEKFWLWYFLLQKCEKEIAVLNIYWIY